MAPPYYLKGPKPFALVLLRFNDVPTPSVPISRFRDFLTSSGEGGLYDYIRDVSNNNITLDNSEVFGWFDMKYSYVNDGWNPFHDPDLTKANRWRNAWIYEAHRLCKENGIDLGKYAGVIACTNANADGGQGDLNSFAMGIGGFWGQNNWWQCTKCQAIAFAGNPTKGKCWDGSPHDIGVAGMKYALSIDEPTFPGQENWRWCNKCESVFWAGPGNVVNNWGSCFAGGTHDATGSANYRMASQVWSGVPITGWKHCWKCHQLAWAKEEANSHCAGELMFARVEQE